MSQSTRETIELLLIGVSMADPKQGAALACHSDATRSLAEAVRLRDGNRVVQWLADRGCVIRGSSVIEGLIEYLKETRLREMVGELQASRGFMTTEEILARIDRIKEFANGQEVEDGPPAGQDGEAKGRAG